MNLQLASILQTSLPLSMYIYPAPSFPTYCNHLRPCHSTALHPTKLQSSCAKEKRPSKKKSPLCWIWSHITVFSISLYERPNWSTTHAKKKKQQKKTNRNIHVSLSLYPETNVIIYNVNQEKKKQKKTQIIRIKSSTCDVNA